MEIKEITDEDMEFIEKAYSIINSAKYPDFRKVTDVHNKVFGTHLNHTSCGSCIRQRVLALKEAVDNLKKKTEPEQ